MAPDIICSAARTLRRRLGVALLAAASVSTLTTPIAAHHSFAAEFDGSTRITLAGTVTRVEWTNPHVFLFVDVRDGHGTVANWTIEMSSPSLLTRLGWRRSTLQIGEAIRVDCSPARFKPHLAVARAVTLVATGRRLAATSSERVP